MSQVTIDFQSQPTSEHLLQVIESATKDKNYGTVLRVANNAIKQFPDLAEAYYYRAIAYGSAGSNRIEELGQLNRYAPGLPTRQKALSDAVKKC